MALPQSHNGYTFSAIQDADVDTVADLFCNDYFKREAFASSCPDDVTKDPMMLVLCKKLVEIAKNQGLAIKATGSDGKIAAFSLAVNRKKGDMSNIDAEFDKHKDKFAAGTIKVLGYIRFVRSHVPDVYAMSGHDSIVESICLSVVGGQNADQVGLPLLKVGHAVLKEKGAKVLVLATSGAILKDFISKQVGSKELARVKFSDYKVDGKAYNTTDNESVVYMGVAA